MVNSNTLEVENAIIADLIKSTYNHKPQSSEKIICLGPTYIAFRHGGRQIFACWRYETDLFEVFSNTLNEAVSKFQRQAFAKFDTIELCLTHSYRRIKLGEFKQAFSNVHRGIRGIEVQYRSNLVRYSPTQIIATNRSYDKIFETFLKRESLSAEAFEVRGGIIQVFEARQISICLEPNTQTPSITATTLFRGNLLVTYEEISTRLLVEAIQGMGEWLLRQVHSNGRMTYKYWPSLGREANSNNTIRQFMATVGLIRYAQYTQKSEHLDITTRNLDYNLQQFYRVEAGIGIIEYEGSAKLGAAALAALGILEHPQGSRYAEVFQNLCRGIESLWQSDGSFRTFHKPKECNDNQNFYPGETLLFWASLYKVTQDKQILERCRQSFYYYQKWHRANRNPAFVPWHTQAYAMLYEATGDRIFLDFIFEMNDWLLPIQQWEAASYLDIQGRFYDPKHPEYGPPHASSTGVYLEGLADAYRLATLTRDNNRAQAYQIAIWRGLRSLRQLQFKDERDMFYISQQNYVLGGLRTTVYDNTIRVDNIQHGLMALLKLTKIPEFNSNFNKSILGKNHDEQQDHKPLKLTSVLSPKSKIYSNFSVLKTGINIDFLMREINKNDSLWLSNTGRQTKIKVQQETQSILLRGAKSPYPPGVKAEDIHESCPTKLYDRFPVIINWVEEIARELDGELCRVNLVRLAPLGKVYRHIDYGEYYRIRDRFHLVLYSPVGSLFMCDREEVRMQEGELWWFDNKKPHEAFNESKEWRIHLIFDLLFSSEKRTKIRLKPNIYLETTLTEQLPIIKLLEVSQKMDPRSLLEKSIKRVDNPEALLQETEDALYEIAPSEKISLAPIHTPSDQSHFLEEEKLTFTNYYTSPLYIAKLHEVILGGKRFTIIDKNGYSIFESLPTYRHQAEIQWLNRMLNISQEILHNSPIKVQANAAVISNSNFKNYWHWHLQCLSNLSLLDVSGILDYVTLVIPPLSNWRRRGIELNNVNEKTAIKVHNTAYCFDVLYFPSLRVKTEQWKTHPIVMKSFNNLKERILSFRAADSLEKSPEKIYVCRLDSPSMRFLENEKDLVERLEQKGFTVITPGAHSLEEQVILFSKARVIVGAHGAGMTNLAYAPPRAEIIEIFPRYYVYEEKLAYCTLSQVAGHNYHAFISTLLGENIKITEVEKMQISVGRNINLSWRIDINSFLVFLESIMGKL